MKKMLVLLVAFCLSHICAYAETVQFDKDNSITMDVPANWEIKKLPGTPLPEIGLAFDIKLTSPVNENASLTVTIGKSQTGKPLTKKQLDTLTKTITAVYFQRSIEKKAAFITLPVNGGQGQYSIFTDASLVNKTPGMNDYKYLVLFLLNYDNGCFVYATGFTNDRSDAVIQNMVKSVSSIEPSFAATIPIPTPPVQIKTNRQGALIGNAVSRVKLHIPSGNLKVVKERIGGGQSSPGYFLFIDEKANLSLSGWLEPIEKFRYDGVKELWEAMQSAEMDMLDPDFMKIGEWEVFLFNLPVPRGFGGMVRSAHMHANLLLENAWINLHISKTAEKTSEVLRSELIEYLKTIQIIK